MLKSLLKISPNFLLREWQFAAFSCKQHGLFNSSSTSTPSTIESHLQKHHDELQLYSIKIRACSELYMAYYQQGLATNKPLTGIDIDVVYADTMPKIASHSTPVILTLHGLVGSHRNFLPLLPHLSGINPRIIMPNFPGFGYTKMDSEKVFSHSSDENSALILNFLKAINVQKVHTIVAHSAAAYTALTLYKQSSMFKSLVLINPGGLRPVKAIRPVMFFRLFSKLIQVPVLQSFVFSVLSSLTKNLRPFVLTAENIVATANTILYIDYITMQDIFTELKLKLNYPVVLAMSQNDPIVSRRLCKELIDLFNFDEESFVHFDAQTKPYSRISTSTIKYPRGLLFDKGGHSLIKTYPEIIAKEIINVLKHLQQSPKQAQLENYKMPHSM